MTKLPKVRKGRAPAWPLVVPPSDVEADLWRDLWRKPQAVAWERISCERLVARYVCLSIASAGPTAHHLLAEVRQLEDRLGLSPMAMLRLRWEVAADELADRREVTPAARRQVAAVDVAAAAD